MRKLVLFGAIALAACTDPDSARQLLEQQGYSDIEIRGYAAWSCSDDDTLKTAFTATTPTGARISGAVCEGLIFKNKTIRFD